MLLLCAAAQAQQPDRDRIPPELRTTAAELREQGLRSDLAWRIVESLTTEIGPRPAGSEQEARARAWAVRWLEALGFSSVRVEEFDMRYWSRGTALEVGVTAPFPQPLTATALGGSAASPSGGIEAEIAFFASFEDLEQLEDAVLAGQIVYVNDRMTRTQTGAGYGPANRKRQRAWMEAERLGAAGVVIRSVGTSGHRFAHTGMMSLPQDRDDPRIPAVAVSNPDADQIERMVRAGHTVRIRIDSDAGFRGTRRSGNVIAEVPGSERAEEIVLIGAHLDSWDEGTGAVDDGAGIAIVTAAAKLISDLPEPPRRTIRIVYFGAEEVGLYGANDYARRHATDLARHVLATESDFGAGSIWRFSTGVSRELDGVMNAVGRELAPLGVLSGARDVRSGGPDITPLADAGVPTVSFDQSGEDYFDLHHTPNDTLDKIVPEALAQNVAVWAAGIWLLASLDVEYRFGAAGSH